jgi:hypothetical protein
MVGKIASKKKKQDNKKNHQQSLVRGGGAPAGKHQSVRKSPSVMKVEGGRVVCGQHAPGRSLVRKCHAPMWRGRWGTRRTSGDSEDADKPNGEAGVVQ